MFPGFRLGVSSLDWPSHPQQCGGHLCIAVHKLEVARSCRTSPIGTFEEPTTPRRKSALPSAQGRRL